MELYVDLKIKNMETKRIDFRKVQAAGVDGIAIVIDVSKELANKLYFSTQDIGMLHFAEEMYQKGEVEVNNERAAAIKQVLESYFTAFVKVALNKLLS
jgi:hypothetical protein